MYNFLIYDKLNLNLYTSMSFERVYYWDLLFNKMAVIVNVDVLIKYNYIWLYSDSFTF